MQTPKIQPLIDGKMEEIYQVCPRVPFPDSWDR